MSKYINAFEAAGYPEEEAAELQQRVDLSVDITMKLEDIMWDVPVSELQMILDIVNSIPLISKCAPLSNQAEAAQYTRDN